MERKSIKDHWNEFWNSITRVWPLWGGLVLFLAFVATCWRFGLAVGAPKIELKEVLEPLSVILGGLGAFLVVTIIIFRKVSGPTPESDAYELARGLATGYYFSFVRLMVGALRDERHALHAKAKELGAEEVAGLVVCIPQFPEQFKAANHSGILDKLFPKTSDGTSSFVLHDFPVPFAGRPRPVFARLAIGTSNKKAFVLDIPTTLEVIPEFATFAAEREIDDPQLVEPRANTIAASETRKFAKETDEFIYGVSKTGALESRARAPGDLLHIVPISRVRQRLDELASP